MQVICTHRVMFHRPLSDLVNGKRETALVAASPDIQEVPDWAANTEHFKALEDEGILRVVEVKHRAPRVSAAAQAKAMDNTPPVVQANQSAPNPDVAVDVTAPSPNRKK